MKYIITFIVMVLVATTHSAHAQENDSMARKSFAMAESAYANAQYKDAVNYVKYAEMYSGGANSRSLYLKIRALDNLANGDPGLLPSLQSALDRFFEVTDKSIYSQDKYQEITAIQNRRKPSAATGATNVIPAAAPNKNSAEQADYEKAIRTKTLEGYKEFLDKYSYTPHYGEIKRKYEELVEDMDEYRNHRTHR